MRTDVLLIAVACCALLPANTSLASEGGTGHYMSGQTTDFSGLATTKPGWIFANYFVNYNNATYGKTIPFGESPQTIGLGVTANATAEVPTLIYGYPFDFFGGTLSSGVSIPFTWVNIKVDGTLANLTKHVEQSASGVGDIEWMPLMAAWTNGDFSYNAMFNFWSPNGDYNPNNLANVGLGYWTFEPMVAFSWISSQIGTEFTLFTGLDFNTKNNESDYQSGDIFHVDATLAQHLPLWDGLAGVGASAFWVKQITGDSGAGASQGGFEAETYGVGPTVSYVQPLGKSTLVADASWLPQLHSDNTTKGDYFWVKIAVAF